MSIDGHVGVWEYVYQHLNRLMMIYKSDGKHWNYLMIYQHLNYLRCKHDDFNDRMGGRPHIWLTMEGWWDGPVPVVHEVHEGIPSEKLEDSSQFSIFKW